MTSSFFSKDCISKISAPAMKLSFLLDVKITPLIDVLLCISLFHRVSASSLSEKDMVFTFLCGLSNRMIAI